MNNVKRVLLASTLLFGMACADLQPSNAYAADINQCLSSLAEKEAFHGSALAGKIGAEPAVIAYSSPDVPGPAVERYSKMSIGSMSKMLTAVGIAQLYDRGEVAFTDTIRKYVPELPAEYDAVTLHHLLTHTSGAGNYFNPSNMQVIKDARNASDLLPFLINDPLLFTPGERFQYSNSGFALLGVLIERVTGQHYADYLKENIFTVAGMENTTLNPNEGPLNGYTRMRPGVPPGEAPADAPLSQSPTSGRYGMPAGGAYSTVDDLFRFASALIENRLTKPETTELILTGNTDARMERRNGDVFYYGYGFMVGSDDDSVGHGGGAPGVNGMLRIRRDSGWVFAALTNTDPPAADGFVAVIEVQIMTNPEQCN